MKRCPASRPFRPVLHAIAGTCLALACSVSPAQSVAESPSDTLSRQFPAQARRGVIRFVAPPAIEVDGRTDRLSPGSRVRSEDNLIVMQSALAGLEACVNFTRDANGQVHEVWILKPEETSQRRAGEPEAVQRNFRFTSDMSCR